MLGHTVLAQWGTPQWGARSPRPTKSFLVDVLAQGTQVLSFSAEGLAGAFGTTLSFGGDSVAQGTATLEFSVDVYQLRIPTAAYRDTCTSPTILVEIDLPTGPIRVANRELVFKGQAWDGRLVSTGKILRTLGTGTDDLQITLDDTDSSGPRFRDLFRTSDPETSPVMVWLVLTDDVAENRVLIFQGSLDRVASFTSISVVLDVLRDEAVLDQTICRLLTQADFPNAPERSISRPIPVIYGPVTTHIGIVIDTNLTAKLGDRVELPLFLTFVVAPPSFVTGIPSSLEAIPLDDATGWPPAGVVQIGTELLAYASRNGNTLTNVTRGYRGSIPTAHTKGAFVTQVGVFAVKFADHQISAVQNVRVLLSDETFGIPVPPPARIIDATATIEWDEQPRIRNPLEEPRYQRVHFNKAGAGNEVSGALSTARESGAYRAFGVAQLSQGTMELLTNTEDLGAPGDIMQVWIAAVFDPDTLGQTGALGPNGPQFQTAPGNAWIEVTTERFNLVPFDLVPPEIARQDEKTGDRLYDVPDPEIMVQVGSVPPMTLSPSLTEDPGLWVFRRISNRVIDQDPDTEAVFLFVGVGEVLISGSAPAYFSLRQPPPLGADDVVVKATLNYAAGWTKTPFTSCFEYGLINDATGKDIVRAVACTKAPSGFSAGLIRGEETFSVELPMGSLGSKLEGLPGITWFIEPIFGVSNGLWVGREFWIDIELERRPPETDITITPKGSVTNYFEVTHLLGISRGNNDPSKDWGFFADPARGGTIRFKPRFPDHTDPQIIETYWVVKHRPFVESRSANPDVTIDCVGIVTDGNPAEISQAIITLPPPLGLGLDYATRISRPDIFRTKATLVADQIRHGIAVNAQTSALSLLEQIGAQADSRTTWDEGKFKMVRRPRADVPLPVFRSLIDADILVNPPLKVSRTEAGDVVTRFEGRYRFFEPSGETSRAIEQVDAAAELKFGQRLGSFDLSFVPDDAAAALLVQLRLERERRPRWVVEFSLPLYGLELRFGDLVSLTHPEFSFDVGEVVALTLETTNFKRVNVTVVVWHAG